MKVITLNHSDISGGAARASYRIHHALRQHGLNSVMYVNHSASGDWTVNGPVSRVDKLWARIRTPLGRSVNLTLKSDHPTLYTPALLPSGWHKRLNPTDADVIHLHWIHDEMMSINDISRINKPIVWTLHDMWAFCGAEHYTEGFRWRDGYTRNNRPAYESGLDLCRLVWQRKMKKWQRPMHIVTPSEWLGRCAKESILMRDWPVTVVPNAIDTTKWHAIEQSVARELLNLPKSVPLLLFGAIGGTQDPRKGFDLLRSALRSLQGQFKDLQLVIFGQNAPREPDQLGFATHYMGHLYDDISLKLLYSAADVMLIPSRQDNLPNTGVEALACGTPVVAFNTCGLPDIVKHHKTGYLAEAFDSEDLANGIRWVLDDQQRHADLSANARTYAVSNFSYPVVAEKYLDVYQSAIDAH